ncbi:hypothetical protein BDR04DRAFT_417616 [Suillus decipiens]|nr:hypothetical protein BDR04DRAFT_417616 [Suillus decipiens]
MGPFFTHFPALHLRRDLPTFPFNHNIHPSIQRNFHPPYLNLYTLYYALHPLHPMTGPIRSKGKGRATDDHEQVRHLPQSQPPRPPNAWILYRSDKIKVLPPAAPGQRSRAQADVSKLISDMWRNESDAVKLEYERLADAKKAEHQRLYPDYRFQPMKKEEKERIREEKRQLKERAREKKKNRGRAGPSQEQHQVVTPQPTQELEPQKATVAYAHPYILPGVAPVQDVPEPIPHHHHPFLDSRMQFGLAGPSPPLSAASSPIPSSTSESSSVSDDLLFRVDALPSARVSPVPDAQAQPSQQLYGGLPPFSRLLPHPQHSYGMESMLVQQPQAAYTQWQAPQSIWPAHQEPILPQSSDSGTVQQHAPQWDDFNASEGTFDYQSQDFLNFDLPACNNLRSIQELENSLQAMLSCTGQNGVFHMGRVSPADILAQPEGELEVEMAPKFDVHSQELENYYNGFDIEAAFATSQEHQPATVNPSGTVNPADTVLNTNLSSVDFKSFFQPNPDVQTYIAEQQRQRQPSAFTRDIMRFINFDAGESESHNVPTPQVGAPPPAPTQSPIFTQMTNTAVVPQSGYVPPAGAANSSTRRVAASWKPTYRIPDDPVIDPALFY